MEGKVAGFFLTFSMLVILVGIFYYYITRKERCTERVNAEIVEVKEYRRGRGRSYRPLFRFVYNSREYFREGAPSGFNPYRTLTTTELWINPDQPEECFDPLLWKKSMRIVLPFVLFLLIAGIYAMMH